MRLQELVHGSNYPALTAGPLTPLAVYSRASLWLDGSYHGSFRKAKTAPSAVAGPTPSLTGMDIVIESWHFRELWLI